MAIMNTSKYPQRSSFISCATGGTSFNHTSFFNPSDAHVSFSSLSSAGSSTSSPINEQPITTFAEQTHQQRAVGPVPRKRGRKRTKITNPDHIPRPVNCFIQFRREWVQAHRDSELAKGDKSLSKLAGEAWNQLSPEDRYHYQSLAKQAKKKHEEEYPDYRYEPKRRTPRIPSSKSHSKRSSSHESDPDWVPSILRNSDSSASSERSSLPPSDMYLSTDDSDIDSLNTPYYSRGSSVDLSYNPDADSPQEAPGFVPSYPTFDSFASVGNAIIPPKDDCTPTQADFSYQIHSQMLPAQHYSQIPLTSSPTLNYPVYGAASNAHDSATLPQYDTQTLPQIPQSSYQYYHALPLQQVAHSLPSDAETVALPPSPPSSQGSEPFSYYNESRYPSSHDLNAASASCIGSSTDTTSPVQWEQNDNNNDSLYASALTHSSQFTMAPPFSDFLGLDTSEAPITPLSRMFFELERSQRTGSSSNSKETEDSYITSLNVPPYWAENVQETFDSGSSSGWNVSN